MHDLAQRPVGDPLPVRQAAPRSAPAPDPTQCERTRAADGSCRSPGSPSTVTKRQPGSASASSNASPSTASSRSRPTNRVSKCLTIASASSDTRQQPGTPQRARSCPCSSSGSTGSTSTASPRSSRVRDPTRISSGLADCSSHAATFATSPEEERRARPQVTSHYLSGVHADPHPGPAHRTSARAPRSASSAPSASPPPPAPP